MKSGSWRSAPAIASPSTSAPVDGSDVLDYFDPDFAKPTKRNLPALAGRPGLTALSTGPGGQGLDYARDILFPLDEMKPIPAEASGVSLANLIDAQVKRAEADSKAVVIAFGEAFSDKGRDKTFGVRPERGLHDIHMMQGNGGSFASDNRVYGDGTLFFRYRGGETAALFLRFTTQNLPADDKTGAPLSR
jgi:uncharacterized protein YukJ